MIKLLFSAFKEFRIQKKLTLLFVLNLALGLSGFIALNTFRNSIENSLSLRSRASLGADFGLSSRRPLSPEVIATTASTLGSSTPASNMVEIYSMVSSLSQQTSRLIQIRAIDARYPFYGDFHLRQAGVQSNGPERTLHRGQTAWVYPEVLLQLNVTAGDQIRIGKADFTIADVIESDPAAGISTSMAPRVYIDIKDLPATQLVTPESLAWFSTLYHLPDRTDTELTDFELKLKRHPTIEGDLRVYSHRTSSEQMGRLLNYLNDYLGLVALAALFLSGVGAVFLFRSYFSSKIYQIAILLSLGVTPNRVIAVTLCQVGFLGLLSALPAIVISFLVVPAITSLTQKLLPISLDVHFGIVTPLIAIALGLSVGVLVCLPIALQIRRLKPNILLRGELAVSAHRLNWLSFLGSLPALMGFWILAVWQAHSFLVGSLFTSLFLGAGFLLGISGFALLKMIDQLSGRLPRLFRLACRDLARHPLSSVASFLSLGLGLLLLNLVPQIQASLEGELKHPDQSRLPSLFLFDIQEDQLSPLRAIAEEFQTELGEVTPLIRARLVKVNSQEFEKDIGGKTFSREDEREASFRNRGFNLTYRERLSDSESIVDGRDFTGPFDESQGKVPEVSVEKRFAERLGIKLGDLLTFDIQSVAVSGRVVSLRSVKWTSFQPNFFVQFQPGVLDLAPKTFLATLPRLDLGKRAQLQNTIVSKLPNVSLIDISRLVAQILEITTQMSWALQFMALLCLVSGFFVLFSISSHQAQKRSWEMNLLKVLGGDSRFVRWFFVVQYAMIALASGLLGVAMSLAVSLVLSRVLFDSLWVWQWQIPTLSLAGMVTMTCVLTSLAARRVLHQKPALLLRSGAE